MGKDIHFVFIPLQIISFYKTGYNIEDFLMEIPMLPS